MKQLNPYQTPEASSRRSAGRPSTRSRWRWAAVGATLGAAVPVGWGCYGMHQFQLYLASLGPNAATCGMPALAAMMMIFFVGPICGILGGVSGWIASGIDWWSAL